MTVLRTALWQCAPSPRDVADNLRRLDAVMADAASRGVQLLVTPELVLTGYDVGDLTGLLDPSDVDRLTELAARHGLALVAGIAMHEEGQTWNCAVAIDRSGTHLATYRKSHLFGDLDGSRFATGTTPFELVEIEGVRVAMMVCYDVEFPETVRSAALAGAQLVAVPTANMHPYAMVCEAVVPVRAYENQVYVGYANHCGTEADTAYVGLSVLAGPDGVVTVAGTTDEQVLIGDVDTNAVGAAQGANPYLTQRRPELYTSLVTTTPRPRTATDME